MRATFQLLAATVSLAATLPRGLEAPVAQVTLQPPAAPGRETFADTLRAEHASLDLRLKDHMTSLPERRRVRFMDPDTGTLREEDITEGEKSLLVLANIQFMDITEEEDSDLQYSDAAAASTFPTQLAYVGKLEGLFSNISLDRMESRLRDFTSFRTRYYRSSEGRHSQAWLLKTIHDIVANGPDLGISVREFEHPWGQNSIILHIPRTAKSHSPDELVIVGAHQDSTNLLPFLNAPGADDDGSGTVTNLEALSLLIASGFRPVNSSVEFHWYSAEEGGMLGSQAIATRYQKDGRSVRAMLQEDMTAFVKPGTEERIGIIQDFVDAGLTSFVEKLIKHYCDIPSVPTKCGYACSDHSSFTAKGWPSAFAIEATFEDSNTGNIHSTRDTMDAQGFSLKHMAQFVKLVLAFTKELSS